MTRPTEKLDQALAAFRREQALGYLRSSARPDLAQGKPRARAFLCSEEALELIDAVASSGELTPELHAGLCAHVARAHAESRYAAARTQSAQLHAVGVAVEGDTRSVGTLLGEWSGQRSPAQRSRLETGLDAALGEHASQLIVARSRADAAAAAVLVRLKGLRHPDAGPEAGAAKLAEDWLSSSADLAAEAFSHARRAAEAGGETGLDNLWAALGSALQGLVPRAGRYRRLAEELAPLGLRSQLARASRLAGEHADAFAAPQLLLVDVPHDVRVMPATRELGLASELLAADALGRATAHVHASPALPRPLRHAAAATVARAMGSLCLLRFTEPAFLRKRRDLNTREAGQVARLSCAFALLDSRLAAAAVLARGLSGPEAQGRAQAFCERALLGAVPPGIALFLTTRLSAGSSFRGKVWGPALVHALREHFDEDWYINPHAAEPLRGAFARAGDFSVEAFASELGARIELGPPKLSELF